MKAEDQLSALSHLDELFEQHGIEYWLFGGWAVDFHAGKMTRPHDDLDLAVWSHDGERVRELLTAAGWRHTPEESYSVYELDDVRLEVAFLDHGEWPPNSFEHDVAEVAGVRARVVSLSSLKADKAVVRDDESVAAKDRADSVTLGPLPRLALCQLRLQNVFGKAPETGPSCSQVASRPDVAGHGVSLPAELRDTTPVQPETRYAKNGNVNIAYQLAGDGPPDLVAVDVISHIELDWEIPSKARFFTRLASICRLFRVNQRGTGMSDRDVGVPTLETRMDDIRAVLDSVGSERAVLFGLGDASPLSVLFAATYPERTAGLILMNASPRFVKGPSLPWLSTREETQREADHFERRWGDPAFACEVIGMLNPSAPGEELQSIARAFRLSVSPGAAAAYIRMNIDVDVCDVLPLIRVPTLVMHRKDGKGWDIRSGRYLAEHIPGARFVELPGAEFSPSFGEQEPVFAELESFLAAVVAGTHPEVEPDRVLATVLFSDIVGSSERAATLGDRAWRELLLRHHELVRRQLARFRGQEVDTAGDGFFASFDGPARAIRCGCAIAEAMPELGLEVRVGLHTGECELVDGKVAGIAVHTGARVAADARPGEVLVSSTVRDLVAGSGLTFEDRGSHELKGIPGEWRLYAVAKSS